MSNDFNKNLLLAILAMDAYNQGYRPRLDHGKTQIGTAEFDKDDSSIDAIAAGFYAASYQTDDGIVISYRGTDNPDPFLTEDGASDVWNGWISGAGVPAGQSALAFEFYETVTGADAFDGEAQGVTLTGH